MACGCSMTGTWAGGGAAGAPPQQPQLADAAVSTGMARPAPCMACGAMADMCSRSSVLSASRSIVRACRALTSSYSNSTCCCTSDGSSGMAIDAGRACAGPTSGCVCRKAPESTWGCPKPCAASIGLSIQVPTGIGCSWASSILEARSACISSAFCSSRVAAWTFSSRICGSSSSPSYCAASSAAISSSSIAAASAARCSATMLKSRKGIPGGLRCQTPAPGGSAAPREGSCTDVSEASSDIEAREPAPRLRPVVRAALLADCKLACTSCLDSKAVGVGGEPFP
mmetsp:Transcript_8477/g.15033  ORF Transcript_8477/g.15033 Transcript_8477/m.15033 type:complete len:284 (-) Transcript_8477:510-1361(-)